MNMLQMNCKLIFTYLKLSRQDESAGN